MHGLAEWHWNIAEEALRLSGKYLENSIKAWEAAIQEVKASQIYLGGIGKYIADFMVPYWSALDTFLYLETEKLLTHSIDETARDYMELLQFNMQIARKGLESSLTAMTEYHMTEASKTNAALVNTIFGREGHDLSATAWRRAKLLEAIVKKYPDEIRAIAPEFGFHFDDGGYVKAAETDRFTLYQVLPKHKGVNFRPDMKPVLIIPPYVLGANILAFLPGEDKSYVHCFANQGIPTYVRIIKDIGRTPAVQVMAGEDDARDMRLFCEKIVAAHGRPVTLNGFCQGGFVCLANLLSGELDGLVDAFITCVTPIDGTRSKALVEYLEHIPPRFRDLGYALKTLPSGNQVVDGRVMSWVYKLKSMDREAPAYVFYRDIKMFDSVDIEKLRINKTAAALNYWLLYDRQDLPPAITKMSFDSYTIPISPEGTLPVKLFGKELNLKRLAEKNIKWLICYAEEDDLVDKEAALAPLDYIDVEVTAFPKGHGAIATSWSLPTSECTLHSCFLGGRRGPVRFHLDLDIQGKQGR